jgi:hypothetical protein
MDACEHIEELGHGEVSPSAAGCEDCLRIGAWWVHLRLCPNRHASAHFTSIGHPVIRSFEPGEAWAWCFVDEVGVED